MDRRRGGRRLHAGRSDRPPLRDDTRVDATRRRLALDSGGCSRSRRPSSPSTAAVPWLCSRSLLLRSRCGMSRFPACRARSVWSMQARRQRRAQPASGDRSPLSPGPAPTSPIQHGFLPRQAQPPWSPMRGRARSAPARSISRLRCRRSRLARSRRVRLLGRRGEVELGTHPLARVHLRPGRVLGRPRSRRGNPGRDGASTSRHSSRTTDSLGGTSDSGHRVWDMGLGWVQEHSLAAFGLVRPVSVPGTVTHYASPGPSGAARSRCETPRSARRSARCTVEAGRRA